MYHKLDESLSPNFALCTNASQSLFQTHDIHVQVADSLPTHFLQHSVATIKRFICEIFTSGIDSRFLSDLVPTVAQMLSARLTATSTDIQAYTVVP